MTKTVPTTLGVQKDGRMESKRLRPSAFFFEKAGDNDRKR